MTAAPKALSPPPIVHAQRIFNFFRSVPAREPPPPVQDPVATIDIPQIATAEKRGADRGGKDLDRRGTRGWPPDGTRTTGQVEVNEKRFVVAGPAAGICTRRNGNWRFLTDGSVRARARVYANYRGTESAIGTRESDGHRGSMENSSVVGIPHGWLRMSREQHTKESTERMGVPFSIKFNWRIACSRWLIWVM